MTDKVDYTRILKIEVTDYQIDYRASNHYN